MFREAFLAKLALLLRGTVAAPPERFGETLADEHICGGGACTVHRHKHQSSMMQCPGCLIWAGERWLRLQQYCCFNELHWFELGAEAD